MEWPLHRSTKRSADGGFSRSSLFSAGISEKSISASGRPIWRPTCVFERASPANVLMRTSLLVTVRSFPSGSACRDEAVTSREPFSAKFVALAELMTILRTVDAQG